MSVDDKCRGKEEKTYLEHHGLLIQVAQMQDLAYFMVEGPYNTEAG